MLSVGDDGKRMGYDAAMELQTQIEKLEARIAALEKMLHGGDATFNTIKCKSWIVVDKDWKMRISASTEADGYAGVRWSDKDGKMRIAAATFGDGLASVRWLDKVGKERIRARTDADGDASVLWLDKDFKVRIDAGTLADGTVKLPTEDLKK